jgi:hypothetical protein
MVVGAADGFTVTLRDTIVQMVAPGEFHGRVLAADWVVAAGGTQLGSLESGALAALTPPVISAFAGGVACSAAVVATGVALQGLARYRLPQGLSGWLRNCLRGHAPDTSVDRCLAVQLAAVFSVQPRVVRPVDERPGWRGATLMNAMAVSRQAELRQCRVRLAADLTAPRAARVRVRAAIAEWDVPVDPDIVAVLTSDLVTHVVHTDGEQAGESLTLAIRTVGGRLRIEVHDSSRTTLGSADAPAPDAAAGGVLTLVGSLSAEWGAYRTPAGLAWFFTLAFTPDLAVGDDRDSQGNSGGDGET